MTGSITTDTETSSGWAECQDSILDKAMLWCPWWVFSPWSLYHPVILVTQIPQWTSLTPELWSKPSLFLLWSPQLSERKFRTAAMLSVFIVSAVVHEYALAMGFGFFYPVMFVLFAIFGGEGHTHCSGNSLCSDINRNDGWWSSSLSSLKLEKKNTVSEWSVLLKICKCPLLQSGLCLQAFKVKICNYSL